jgi:hypothetical protein
MASLVTPAIISLVTATPKMAQAAADGAGMIHAGSRVRMMMRTLALRRVLVRRYGVHGWSRRHKRRASTARLALARQPRAHTWRQTGRLLANQPGTGLLAMALADPGITLTRGSRRLGDHTGDDRGIHFSWNDLVIANNVKGGGFPLSRQDDGFAQITPQRASGLSFRRRRLRS